MKLLFSHCKKYKRKKLGIVPKLKTGTKYLENVDIYKTVVNKKGNGKSCRRIQNWKEKENLRKKTNKLGLSCALLRSA